MKKIGVTLIELLIVMIIIAILSVVIFVSMTGSLEDAETTQRKEAAGNFLSGIRSGQAPPMVNENTDSVEDVVIQQNEESKESLKNSDEDGIYEDSAAMSDDLEEVISSRSDQLLEDERGRAESERSAPESDDRGKDPQ